MLSPFRIRPLIESPQLRPLVPRVPAVRGRSKRKYALLRPALFLVAPRAAEGRIEAVLVERLLERFRLHHVGVDGRSVRERPDAGAQAVLVGVDDQVETEFGGATIAKRDHFLEFPGRVDMEKRKWRLRWPERLQGKVQHHRAVLADRVQHHWFRELRDDLAHNVDALGFKLRKMTGRIDCRHRSQGLIRVIVAEPGYEPADALLDWSRRPEADVAHQVVDVGPGLGHVAGLHRCQLDFRPAA